MTPDHLPPCWRSALADEFSAVYYRELTEWIAEERRRYPVYPPESDVFAAFRLTPLATVRVLLLGQDPYHDVGQAHGLCFSVPRGAALPPSLRNILQELKDDIGCPVSRHGCLECWARQGVLLLNAVLTVRTGEPNSHQRRGWERFTDAAIAAVNAKEERVVFVFWGSFAQKKASGIDSSRHVVLTAPHPSPLSAYRGFFGSRPFSRINAALAEAGRATIDWELK